MSKAKLWAFSWLVAGVACLPNPQSVKERRESFERSHLKGSLIVDAVPNGATRVDAEFGGRARLVATLVDPPQPKPGQSVEITFYWTAIKTMAEDYQVFVHGDAMGGNASRVHGDHFPAQGKYPTDVWRPGEIVADTFKIFVPPGYGAPRLGVYTGLYKGNYRVPLTNRGQRPGGSDNRSLAVELIF